ncbi:MAG: Gx transporter family protein [Gammaproteobacteria bacterium]|nr:Gx transporter family protein [Gammaproteobacteria bacterium]
MATTQVTVSAEDWRIAQLAALGIAIHVLEGAFPSLLPGVKPGLANVITLTVCFLYGWKAAVWVSMLRVLGGSLLAGTFMTPTFFLSLGGAVAMLMAMALLLWLGRGRFAGLTPIGVGVLAAVAHMLGQFVLAWALFVPHPALLGLLPVLLTAALVFGIINGWICHYLLKRLKTDDVVTAL